MRLADSPYSDPLHGSGSFRQQTDLRNRLRAIALTLAIMALFAAGLVGLGVVSADRPGNGHNLVSMSFSADSNSQKAQHKSHQPTPKTQQSTAQTSPTPKPVEPVTPVTPPGFLHLSRDEFASTDISHMAHQSREGGAASSADSQAAYGPGEGPGGARLYVAEWYREPTHAELAPYLPHNDSDGEWAMIACRTVEHYHVEDCQELTESPPGSGLARALRQAAWQFLVRPPRMNGQAMIGSWVKIRFEFKTVKARG